jgi:hypothetical protein
MSQPLQVADGVVEVRDRVHEGRPLARDDPFVVEAGLRQGEIALRSRR